MADSFSFPLVQFTRQTYNHNTVRYLGITQLGRLNLIGGVGIVEVELTAFLTILVALLDGLDDVPIWTSLQHLIEFILIFLVLGSLLSVLQLYDESGYIHLVHPRRLPLLPPRCTDSI